VIELSDEEGEDGMGDDSMRVVLNGNDADISVVRNGGTGRALFSPSPRTSAASGTATPSGTPLLISPRVSTMTPAVLLEKEQEINRLRELIAQRELNRKKKQAVCAVQQR
jgi:hypothetical protein